MKIENIFLLETPRLAIRAWSENDLSNLKILTSDIGYTSLGAPKEFVEKSDSEILANLHQRISLFTATKIGCFVIEDKQTSDLIGTCGLETLTFNGSTTVELNVRIRLKHWTKGFATEAATAVLNYGFESLQIPLIHAHTYTQNRAAFRVLEKLGFTFENDILTAGFSHRLYSIRRGETAHTKAAVLALHHGQVSIPSGTEEKIREFYCSFLGLAELKKPDSLIGRGGLWVQLGENQIHFGAENGVDRSATKAHLAYLVSNIAVWKERLQLRGAEVLDGIPIPGFERFEFRDPVGNRVEFLEKS